MKIRKWAARHPATARWLIFLGCVWISATGYKIGATLGWEGLALPELYFPLFAGLVLWAATYGRSAFVIYSSCFFIWIGIGNHRHFDQTATAALPTLPAAVYVVPKEKTAFEGVKTIRVWVKKGVEKMQKPFFSKNLPFWAKFLFLIGFTLAGILAAYFLVFIGCQLSCAGYEVAGTMVAILALAVAAFSAFLLGLAFYHLIRGIILKIQGKKQRRAQ